MSAGWERVAGPEARIHGAAWTAFHSTIHTRPVTASTEDMRHDWLMFLAGWKAKCDRRAGFGK